MQNVDEIVVGNCKDDDLTKYEVSLLGEKDVNEKNFRKMLDSSKVTEVCAALDFLLGNPSFAISVIDNLTSMIAKGTPVVQ